MPEIFSKTVQKQKEKNHFNHILFKLILLLCEKCLKHISLPFMKPMYTKMYNRNRMDRYTCPLFSIHDHVTNIPLYNTSPYVYRANKKSYLLYVENCESLKLHITLRLFDMDTHAVDGQLYLSINSSHKFAAKTESY